MAWLAFRRPQLLRPHAAVQNMSMIDFGALEASGIRVVIFDKDNCLTRPYENSIHAPFAVCFYSFLRRQ